MAKKNLQVVAATKAPPPQFDTRIDIDPRSRAQLVELLNARLADSLDLQTQAKFAHWNVKGKDFYQLHLLFDEVAEHAEDTVDLIAERITALGGRAEGTLRQAAANSSLPEYETDAVQGMDHVRFLADRVGLTGNSVREAVDRSMELGDQATADMFTEILRSLDKDLYFLESHIQV
jgi:starvation-inducible DNA-binding protein